MFGFGGGEASTETPAGAPETPVVDPATLVEASKGLDIWAGILDNPKPEGDEEPKVPTGPFDPAALLADDEAMAALTSKLDFSNALSAETQQKMQDQDPSALMDAMEDMGKAMYAQAMRHGAVMNARAMNERFDAADSKVSSTISQHVDDRELAGQLPEISNPLIAMGVQPFIDKLRKANPSMSTTDVATQVRAYMGEANNVLNRPPPTPESEKEIDWFEELGIQD